MKLKNKFLRLVLLVGATLFFFQAHADDQQDINQLIQNLYKEDIKPLVCADSNGHRNSQSITVPKLYFSDEFVKYYLPACVKLLTDWLGDPRTGEQDSFSYEISKAGFTNLKIAPPKIIGTHASIRTTYDLPVASYEQYKNFTLFSLIKENGQWKIDDIELGGQDFDKYNKREPMTGLQVIKSLKQYIKKGLAEHEVKKASEKK